MLGYEWTGEGVEKERKQGDLLERYFSNLEKHNYNSTTESETWSDPECILKVESERFPERLDIGIERKKKHE